MTEKEWLGARTVLGLDLWRSAKNWHRKWRLFAAACCRRAIELVNDARLEPVAEAAEQFADGEITWEQVKQTRKVLTRIGREVGDPFGPRESLRHTVEALDHATQQKPVGALGGSDKAASAFTYLQRLSISDDRERLDDFERRGAAEEKEQLLLARCIFGNPFRPVAFDPAWRTESVVALARTAYDTRNFTLLPILADALEEAGCDHADILSHCRDPKATHARGCWVVDLVLDKS